MADETTPVKLKASQVHPKVAMATVVGALVAVVIGVLKQNGTDLTPYSSQLIIIGTAVGGWLAPNL